MRPGSTGLAPRSGRATWPGPTSPCPTSGWRRRPPIAWLPRRRAAARSTPWWPKTARWWGTTPTSGGLRLAREWAGIPAAAPVLVLGAGGAAAAALVAFAGSSLIVATRRRGGGAGAGRLPGRPGAGGALGGAGPGGVVVNATPLGMQGEALPPGVVEEARGLIDLPYGAEATPAVATARRRGLPVADGLEVLVAQAALSFRLWTGREAPLDVMRRAAGAAPPGV